MQANDPQGTTAGDEHQFATKVDNWLLAVLVGAGIVTVASVLLSAATDPRAAVVGLVVVALTFGMVLLLAVPTHYTIGTSELVVRSGVLRYRIPLDGIIRVYPTRNPLSAPAWSLNRLGIVYTKGRSRSFALISPERRDEFLELLAARARLESVGEELQRPGGARG